MQGLNYSEAGLALLIDHGDFDDHIGGPAGEGPSLPEHLRGVVRGDFHADRAVTQHGANPPGAFFQIIDAVLEHDAGVCGHPIHHALRQPLFDLTVIRRV